MLDKKQLLSINHLLKSFTKQGSKFNSTKCRTGDYGSREEDEVSGFFVLSHLWMRGYFRLG